MAFPTGFDLIETVPGKTEWGLDTLRRSYKSGFAADVAILDTFSPAKYTADSDNAGQHTNMWLTDKTVTETSEASSRLDLVYTGLLNGSALPPGKRRSGASIQSAQATVSGVPVSIIVASPQQQFDWLSTQPGIGAPIVTSVAAGPNIQKLSGTVVIQNNGTQLFDKTGFGGLVNVKDIVYVQIDIKYPPPYTVGQLTELYGLLPFRVDSIINATTLGVTPFFTVSYNGQITYFPDGSFVLHPSNVQALSIRWGCGLSSFFSGVDPTLWGQLLVDIAFTSITSLVTESEELVPDKFWKNTQRATVQLFPISC